ncbi:MAG: competence/damage-inducible protein A [Anaerolineae bacterium]|nr:competence/damage-inducible protein A [Anaerolineae bacterium]
MPDVGLLVIGNELLNGAVRDKNLFTLTYELTQLGLTVEHAIMVRDEPDMIACFLHFMLAQNLDVILCSGGLGPTVDDLTLSALANALQRPLERNPEAYALVEAHYERLLNQHYLTQHGPQAAREKMATLPRGAIPLPNPVGTAPGVQLEYEGTLLYVLPGVPAELEAIFAESVVPELRRRFLLSTWVEQALLVHCDDEADVAPILREIGASYPQVYLKSLAKPFPAASAEGLRVMVAVSEPEAEVAQATITRVLAELCVHLEAAGFRVERL